MSATRCVQKGAKGVYCVRSCIPTILNLFRFTVYCRSESVCETHHCLDVQSQFLQSVSSITGFPAVSAHKDLVYGSFVETTLKQLQSKIQAGDVNAESSNRRR